MRNALKDFTETEVEEIAPYLDFKEKAMMGRAKVVDKDAQGNVTKKKVLNQSSGIPVQQGMLMNKTVTIIGRLAILVIRCVRISLGGQTLK